MLQTILNLIVRFALIVNNLDLIRTGMAWMRAEAGTRRRVMFLYVRYLISETMNVAAWMGIVTTVAAMFLVILVVAPHGNLLAEGWGWALFGIGISAIGVFAYFIFMTWGARSMPLSVCEQVADGEIALEDAVNRYSEGNAPYKAFFVTWMLVFGSFAAFCLLASGWLYTYGCVAHGSLIPIFVVMFVNVGLALLPLWPVRALGRVMKVSDKPLEQILGVAVKELIIIGTTATPTTIGNVTPPDKVDLPVDKGGDFLLTFGVGAITGVLVIFIVHVAEPDLRMTPWTLLLLALAAAAAWMTGSSSKKGVAIFLSGIGFVVALRILQALGVLSVGWGLVATPLNGLVEILNGFLHPSGFWAGLGIFVVSAALAGVAFAATPKGIVGKVAKWGFMTPFASIALVTVCAALAAMSHQSIRYLPHWDPPVTQACVLPQQSI